MFQKVRHYILTLYIEPDKLLGSYILKKIFVTLSLRKQYHKF